MSRFSRRRFVRSAGAAALGVGSAAPFSAAGEETAAPQRSEFQHLEGEWSFRVDADNAGESRGWQLEAAPPGEWTTVTVPHTWQVQPETADYLGVAWYRRSFDVPESWRGRWVRVEFEAVYHTATVWVNGKLAGSHRRKGYTAFTLDLTPVLRFGGRNTLAVRVDNSFRDEMLPRNNSYDWAADGGITRPVRLIATPRVFIERIEIDAEPDLAKGYAEIRARALVRNTLDGPVKAAIDATVVDEQTGLAVLRLAPGPETLVEPGSRRTLEVPAARLAKPRLWHFDHPHLYQLEARLTTGGGAGHALATGFGIRKIEVVNGGFLFNGERVRLMGVERMAGSNPEFGMAEPEAWIRHDLADMKELNCVFTRVHWQQDRRVLDYCDRHGILIQVEVPSWGPRTFAGMKDHPSAAIMQNGLEQLREMITRDRNHPCIFSWGLCNEVNGQNPPAQEFVRRMYREAKRLDPSRPLTYASNSLQRTPERDVAGEMDFVMWNEYYESWMKGTVADMRRNLETIHQAFPAKPIVISEYGYCECRPSHTGGDPKRIDILQRHTDVFREFDWLAGAIFFDYNDYRTHIGDKGAGPLKQRVHGVVDLYGERKPSYAELRRQSSPVEQLEVAAESGGYTVTIVTRRRLPAYTLRGYRLRWIVYGFGGLPMEAGTAGIPVLRPGGSAALRVRIQEKAPRRVRFDVIRPTGFSAATAIWKA